MGLKVVRFCSLFFMALGLAPGMAHVLELPHKINLSAEEYLTVQQIYRGWALLGFVELAALLSTLALTIMTRKNRGMFVLSLVTLLCITANLILFFTFTFPVNQQTANWTVLLDNWQALRNQWEYSHAVNAGLYLIALVTLILAVLTGEDRQR